MKKKINKTQILRFIVQIFFLILLPGLFTLAFSQIKTIYEMLAKGNFNFISALPRLAEAAAIFPITIIFGRFFCGWICAFGTFNDLVYTVSRKVFKVKFTVNSKLDSILKYLKYVILVFIVSFIWISKSSLFSSSSPWDAFAQLSQFPGALNDYAVGFALLFLITTGAAFIERFFCRYLCPLGGIFALISKIRIFKINKPSDKCGKCRLCTNSCSMGIELYKTNSVISGECINCLKCINVCPRKNTQAVILEEPVNGTMASSLAISAFLGLYAASNSIGSSINANATVTAAPGANTAATSTTSTASGTTTSAAQATSKIYKDGTYTGVGRGYRPGLTVSVTIKNDKITQISVLQNDETQSYSQYPISVIPGEIIKAQSTNVDAVSGATRTSNGIMQAVEDALTQAKN